MYLKAEHVAVESSYFGENTSQTKINIFGEHPYLQLAMIVYPNKEATDMCRDREDQTYRREAHAKTLLKEIYG